MKKILIVDDRGKYLHPYIDNVRFVDFYEKINDLENFSFDKYITAIVHQRNEFELEYAKKYFEHLIIISGGKDFPEKVKNIYFIPRNYYQENINKFLDTYLLSGKLNFEIFWE